MVLGINLTLFVIACVILVLSNNFLVKSLSKISYFLNLNEFTIGFILVSLATSLPEIFVGVMSAINGIPEFSIGNVIGSNILDLTLVIGIAALLAKTIHIDSKIIRKDMVYMLVLVMLPVFLFVDHHIWNRFGLFKGMTPGLSRIDGVILLFGFVSYIYRLIRQESKFSKTVEHTPKKEAIKYMAIFLASLTLLLVSAHYVVSYAEALSIDINISPFLMGIFLISLGTSLPELMFEAKAVMTGHQSMAIGDLVGSVITNSTLVLGITAVIMPIHVNAAIYLTSIMFMLFASFIFFTLAESDNKITWTEGIALLLLYVLF
ncbi:sodium:calcium antiporter, partial [archaeon]|nr:sodium:calcium antiporter [archaeon]